jgi:hypothetical protein
MGPRGISCRNIFDEAIIDHDFYTGKVFPPIQQALQSIPGVSQEFIDKFKSVVTVYADTTTNAKCAIYACARVNVDQIVADLRACSNESQAREVLRAVIRQMRSAAICGIYKRIFTVTREMWIKEEDYEKRFAMSKRIEQRLQNIIGGVFHTRFIPDSLEAWEMPVNLNKYICDEEENEAKRSEAEIMRVVDTFGNMLKAEIAKQGGGV